MKLEDTLAAIKQEGLGYFYSWGDKLWSFGNEKKQAILPYSAYGIDSAVNIEPISHARAYLLDVPWLHVGDIKITTAEKSEMASRKMMGRVIFFHTPLDKKHPIRQEFKDPFVISNKVRGTKNQILAGPELTIIGEYESTSILAQELSSGSKNFLSLIPKIFNITEKEMNAYVSYAYRDQKTFELFDPTRRPKLNVNYESI